jgi:hypothetical protein
VHQRRNGNTPAYVALRCRCRVRKGLVSSYITPSHPVSPLNPILKKKTLSTQLSIYSTRQNEIKKKPQQKVVPRSSRKTARNAHGVGKESIAKPINGRTDSRHHEVEFAERRGRQENGHASCPFAACSQSLERYVCCVCGLELAYALPRYSLAEKKKRTSHKTIHIVIFQKPSSLQILHHPPPPPHPIPNLRPPIIRQPSPLEQQPKHIHLHILLP